MLRFDGAWRVRPPTDSEWLTQAIPAAAVEAFRGLINQVATQEDRQEILEHFKGGFSAAAGLPHSRSSSVGWAESDLEEYMRQAAQNAPLFLEALFDACKSLQGGKEDYYAPDAELINAVCLEHRVGYEIQPPDLVLRGELTPLVAVPDRPPTLAEEAIFHYQQSLQRAEQLLSEGHSHEAVQETLWLLESITTAFRGLEAAGAVVHGKYFNQIVRDLRNLFQGTTLERVLDWTTTLHGFLSSPTGGGIRHGLDLRQGLAISPNEARLFCNLVRSYISYLLAEHERLRRHQTELSLS